MVASGAVGAGYATADGVGLHYVGNRLKEAVSIRPTAKARRVQPDGRGSYREVAVAPRVI
jgi:hypothetical protein